MKILLVNKYFHKKGGDAIVLFNTASLLEIKGGHQPIFFAMQHPLNLPSPYASYFVSKVDLNANGNLRHKLKTAGRLLYSLEAKGKIGNLIEKEQPDIAHLHSICHQISPSIIDILKKNNIPIVMTLHDYKLTCPVYTLLLDGHTCELCTGGQYYYALLNRCTKGSYFKSALNMIEMYLHHKMLHVYDKVDLFISPSRFLMEKTREMGFNGEIVHLPNFIDASEYQPVYNGREKSIVYFGRLSQEKGVPTLIDAVKGLDVLLKIIGEGPQKELLEEKVAREAMNNVCFLGYKRGAELKEEIRKSLLVVLPSEWYENNPRSVLEAFALGKPVIGSRIGGIPELVRDNETGITFEPRNSNELREKINLLLGNREQILEMGQRARKLVEEEFNPEMHYHALMAIYEKAMVLNRER